MNTWIQFTLMLIILLLWQFSGVKPEPIYSSTTKYKITMFRQSVFFFHFVFISSSQILWALNEQEHLKKINVKERREAKKNSNTVMAYNVWCSQHRITPWMCCVRRFFFFLSFFRVSIKMVYYFNIMTSFGIPFHLFGWLSISWMCGLCICVPKSDDVGVSHSQTS